MNLPAAFTINNDDKAVLSSCRASPWRGRASIPSVPSVISVLSVISVSLRFPLVNLPPKPPDNKEKFPIFAWKFHLVYDKEHCL